MINTVFCTFVFVLVPDMSKNEPLVTGLEWEDPMHVNVLSQREERRLKLLIAKIAALVNMRRLVLRPYFQDYELVRLFNHHHHHYRQPFLCPTAVTRLLHSWVKKVFFCLPWGCILTHLHGYQNGLGTKQLVDYVIYICPTVHIQLVESVASFNRSGLT